VAARGTEFRILGPLEVSLDGRPVRIGGPRQRALLALLLLSANRIVSRDHLTDELFRDAPVDGADHALRVQVSRLRKALGPVGEGRLVTSPPGYLLHVEPGELDLDLFDRLVDDGRSAIQMGDLEAGVAKLREADSLWRGRPLADLEFEPFARVEVERLLDLRLAAAEDRIEAELALGRHALLVSELEASVGEHPLRERLRGQLMLALYRSGRQAEALEAYRAGRSLLSEQLALEPSPALRELEQAILRQDPALELEATTERSATRVLAAPQAPPGEALSEPVAVTERPHRWRRPVTAGTLMLAIAAVIAGAIATTRVTVESGTVEVLANSVAVIDTSKNAVRAVLHRAAPPGGIASGAGAVWVSDTANDQLLRIDPRLGVQRIAVGHGPTAVAVGGGQVWVVNQLDRTVSAINPRALKEVATFRVGNGATAAAFGGGALWVANATDATVSRIEPTLGRVATISLAGAPQALAAGRDGLWVTSSTGQLLLIDFESNRAQAFPIGSSPAGVALGGGSVWVSNTAEATVTRFKPSSGKVTKINVGKAPSGVTFGAGAVWVANGVDGTVARIDPETEATRLVHVGNEPAALAISGGELWATVLAAPSSHRGGTLRVAVRPPFSTIGGSVDPAVFGGIAKWQMLSLTNDGLVSYRRVGGLAGNTLVPDLATALPTPTDAGRTYTFHVRHGARYSTGGRVGPADFRRAIERVFKVGNDYTQSFYRGIDGAEHCSRQPRGCTLDRGIVVDDRANTVTFRLTAADPDFMYKLAFPMAAAVPPGTPDHDVGREPLPATGPYMTRSVSLAHERKVQGHGPTFDSWTIVRNPRFQEWSPDAQPNGYPDRITLTAAADSRSAVRAVERGRSDVLLSPSAGELQELATRYTTQLHTNPLAATFALAMNTRVPPFDHLAARRALNYAIDRRRILALAGGPLNAQPTCQILPPTLPGYQPYCPYSVAPSASGTWTAPDLAKAEQLIRASGTRGSKVTVLVPPADLTAPTTEIGRHVVGVLDRLGYRASLRVIREDFLPGPFADSRSRGQIGWFTWLQDYPAPFGFIEPVLACSAFIPHDELNLNVAEFCEPKIDARIKRAWMLQQADAGTAGKQWSKIDRDLVDRAPWVPLYNPRVPVVVSKRVGNYQYHPFWQVMLDQLWVR
jgi:ABC-type transport system substrate-binding protein/DNA-binding SARP family transcriptional activator